MTKCYNCKFCTGGMEDMIDGVWYGYYICEIEGPILDEIATDDNQDCDLYVENVDDRFGTSH